jgi:thiol:disulfide interchange protein DsbG
MPPPSLLFIGSRIFSATLLHARYRSWFGAALLFLGAAPFFVHADPPGRTADSASWQALERAAAVTQGAPRPEHLLYVITDADCPYCHDLWLELQPFYVRGLQVRYVMVGVISPESVGKAAAILEARSPSLALDENEKRWAQRPDDLGGGIAPLRKPRAATTQALRLNEQLMRELGVPGTPALIFRDAGHALHVVRSAPAPAQLKSVVAAAAPD